MNSKIVILDDSVILYQHYINNEDWESVMAFPRGGLTYLIKNNNIKFYAYIDYFYRNCLMTMDLPLYIVDEELGIDGEYDDIEELTEILNRIFPANGDGGEIDLTPYLKKREAAELYQPIGSYFDGVDYDSSGKTIDFYSDGVLVDSIDATDFIKDGMVDSVSLIELSGDTYLHIVFNTDSGKEPIDINLGDLFNADDYYTKQESDARFQPIGNYQPAGDYALKSEIPSLSGYATEQWVENKNYLTEHQPLKTINGQVISGTGNIEIDCSGGTVDAYTKAESDARFQPIGDYALKSEIPEVPSLDGYATETWVNNQGYINHIKTINNISLIGEGNIQIGSGGTIDAYTKAEADELFQPKGNYATESALIQYITNLQNQITSIIESVSGCCSDTGETIYRWITMTGENDYICSGTSKYAKEKKQQSTDNGMTWTDVVPAQYQRGVLLEADSSDCGYEPTIEYRWVTVSGGYVCSGTTKYNQEKKQYRVDGGAWIDTDPLQTRRGSTVIETKSTDCGYIAPQYRWYQAPASDYICSGTSKYYKEYYQVSNDGGNTWNNVTPTQTRQGSLIETQSTDCGYIEPKYRWRDTTSTTCSGYNKVYVSRQQVSYDNGQTWQNTSTTGYGSTIEEMSYDCGYVGNPKVKLITESGHTYQVNCNSSPILTQEEINRCKDAYEDECGGSWEVGSCVTHIGSGITPTQFASACATAITLSNSVQYIGTHSFENCISLTGMTIPSSVTRIESQAFSNCSGMTSIDIPASVTYLGTGCFSGCTGLQTIIVRATTPPALGGIGVFENGNSCPIYVPAASVNAYKSAWSSYSTRIQAIP